MLVRRFFVAVLVLWLAMSSVPAGALPSPDDPGDGGGGGGSGEPPIELDWQPSVAALGGTPFPVLLPTRTPLLPEFRRGGPYGLWQADCVNDFCMPNLPVTAPFCMDPVNLPGDNMVKDGRNYGNIAKSCYQLVLAIAFQSATGVDPNPIEFTVQQFERNIHAQCNEQFPAWSLNKYRCYGAAGVAANLARPLVQETYGRIPLPGFNVGTKAPIIPAFPHPFAVSYRTANQPSHAFTAICNPGGSSCRPTIGGANYGPGTRMFLTGVVKPKSKILFTFEDSNGDVLDWWITAEARDNGVVHHEREEFNLDRIRRGPVRVVARFLQWETNQTVRATVANINLVTGGTGGGGGGGGGGCELLSLKDAFASAIPSNCEPI